MTDAELESEVYKLQVILTLSNLFILMSAFSRIVRMLLVTDMFSAQVTMLQQCLYDLGQFSFFFFLMILFFFQTFEVLGATYDENTFDKGFDHTN